MGFFVATGIANRLSLFRLLIFLFLLFFLFIVLLFIVFARRRLLSVRRLCFPSVRMRWFRGRSRRGLSWLSRRLGGRRGLGFGWRSWFRLGWRRCLRFGGWRRCCFGLRGWWRLCCHWCGLDGRGLSGRRRSRSLGRSRDWLAGDCGRADGGVPRDGLRSRRNRLDRDCDRLRVRSSNRLLALAVDQHRPLLRNGSRLGDGVQNQRLRRGPGLGTRGLDVSQLLRV